MWKEFWKEASTPSSRGEGPHIWAALAAGHFLIGSSLGASLPINALWIAIIYWVAKEAFDLWRGGRFLDGVIDAGFVFVGALTMPLIAIVTIALGIQFYSTVRSL